MGEIEKSPSKNRKRKLDDDPTIEIDVSAPEPPSKKALRKAKKKSADTQTQDADPPAESNDNAQKPAPQSANKRTTFGIWIGNLAFSTTKDDLRAFLTTRGSFSKDEITRIHVPEDATKQKGIHRNKGFAYIDFTTSDAVQRAIALSEQELSGRRVLIKDANNFAGRPEKTTQNDSKAPAASKMAPSHKIFVGNLPFETTKEMLDEHFKRCGPLTMVHMATFQDTGTCKGYAWVEFEAIESAEAAVRGFVKVPEEDSDEAESSEESGGQQPKKSKKEKEKKIWVNRLLGRTLRTDFAEDPTTRYQKRFGKDAKPKNAEAQPNIGADGGGIDNGSGDPIQEVSEKRVRQKRLSSNKSDQRPKSHSRYSEDTVQKLSGAIVASEGKKTTFD